jgi:predicted dehydrogenase
MSAQPQVSTARRPLRLGFIGLGWIGRKRLEAIAADSAIEVAALSDAAWDRACSAGEQYPDAFVARDLQQLLSCELDGVVIATPNAYHAGQARACLERGVPVFCQKPLATSAAETAQIVAGAQAVDRLLGVDFCYRHVQGMHELRERIAAGALGALVCIDLEFHNAYSPDKAWSRDRRLAGGGCMLDLGVHLLDLALWLQAGPDLRLTTAHLFERGQRVRRADAFIEDLALAEFRQSNGATTRLACSWNAHIGQGATIGMRLLGTAGGAHWRNVDGSFYDFHLDVACGDRRERIGAAPDDWGARALLSWARQLQLDPSFDPAISLALRGAELIDQVYRA